MTPLTAEAAALASRAILQDALRALHEAVAADAEGCPRCARLEAELTQAFQPRRPPRRLDQDANQ